MSELESAVRTGRSGRTERPERQRRDLRLQALGVSIALLCELLLGMAVNLDATLPAADRGAGSCRQSGARCRMARRRWPCTLCSACCW